jgi:hypothetical protein
MMTLVMIFATVAEAQRPSVLARGWQRENRWDMSLSTRYTDGKTFDGEGGSSATLENNLGWGFGFGYNFNQHFNLGVMFNWRSIPYSAQVINAEDQSVENYSNRLSTSTFALNGEYNVLKGKFTPYVSGNLGWTHLDTNVFAGWTTGCYWYPYWGYRCGPVALTYGSDVASYGLGLGGRFEMSDSFFLKFGYERAWLDNNTVDGTDIIRLDIGLML